MLHSQHHNPEENKHSAAETQVAFIVEELLEEKQPVTRTQFFSLSRCLENFHTCSQHDGKKASYLLLLVVSAHSLFICAEIQVFHRYASFECNSWTYIVEPNLLLSPIYPGLK